MKLNSNKSIICLILILSACTSTSAPINNNELLDSTSGSRSLALENRDQFNHRSIKSSKLNVGRHHKGGLTENKNSNTSTFKKATQSRSLETPNLPEKIEITETQDKTDNNDAVVVKLVEKKIDYNETRTGNVLKGNYAKIANATRANAFLAGQAQLEASDHSLEAHKQTLLPQLRPGASVNSDGDLVASVNVDQVLFDSGRYNASENILLSEKGNVAANLKIEESDKIANAISAYIQYHRAREAQDLSSEVVDVFGKFERQSERRLFNGIGDNSEQALFNLKKIEAQADFDSYNSEALTSRRSLRTLANISMPKEEPSRFTLSRQLINAPRVELAAAERDQAQSRLEFDKADRMPRVSLNGNIGTATDSFDEEDLDLRVEVSMNQPLNWGFDHGLASSRSELEASRLRYENTKKEVSDRLSILQLEIKQEEANIKRIRKVMIAGKRRLKDFDAQFLAGQAGIVEVVSIVETYKKSKMNLIDSKYNILNLELELATLNGALTY